MHCLVISYQSNAELRINDILTDRRENSSLCRRRLFLVVIFRYRFGKLCVTRDLKRHHVKVTPVLKVVYISDMTWNTGLLLVTRLPKRVAREN